jgi:phosphoserine phosphatase
MDLYNGTLDVSTQAEIIEMLKDADAVREAVEQAKEAFINDYLGLDSESISAESRALKSVKLSQFNS